MARKTSPTPLNPVHVSNVVQCVLSATESERTGGLLWYKAYNRNIVRFGKRHGLTADQSLAIFAILSQQARIRRNWDNFCIVVETKGFVGTVNVYTAMRAKCLMALEDATNPGQYARGSKIANFYRNLSGDTDVVTVDRHAISCQYGRMLNSVKNEAEYRYAERVYQAAAAIVGLTPRDTQAVAWVVWRRKKGLVDEELSG